MEQELVDAINQYGFPIIAAVGLGYFVFFIWRWATEDIDAIIGDAQTTLIKLIDRVRMLDNDMIRLNTKLAMVLEYRLQLEANLPPEKIHELDEAIAKYQSISQSFNSTGNPGDNKKNQSTSETSKKQQ